MKPQTFFRLALLLPYVLWGVCVLIVTLFGAFDSEWMDRQAPIFLLVEWIVSIYMIGILFWFLPYTLLALFLWIWSLRRPAGTILRMFAASPFILAILIIMEISILVLVPGGIPSISSSMGVANFWAFIGVTTLITLVAGYICVGLGLGLYRLLQRLEIIREPRAQLPGAATQTTG
jgi:hypothetical protein